MALLDRTNYRPAFVHPANVKAIAELFPTLVPDWKSVVMNHTRYRLNSAFLSAPNKRKLLTQYRSGTAHGATSHVVTNQLVLRGRLGICLSCIASDFEVHGFAIWHRIHLMPSILYCPTHEEPLMNFCPRCDISHRRAPKTWHPGEKCLCGGPLRSIAAIRNRKSIEAAVAIAQMAEDVLEGRIDTSALADNTGPVLRAQVRRIAQMLDSRNYCQVARERLELRLGTELTSALGFTALTFKRATGHTTTAGPLRNPIQNIASIWSLFGGWSDFLSEVIARKANPERYDASTRKPPKRVRVLPDNKFERWRRHFKKMDVIELKHFRETCRSTILAAKTLNPGFMRSEIRNVPDGQKLTFFATHYDQRWLDRNLPSQARKQSLPKVIDRKHRQDMKRRELVRQRYADTIRDNPERRITRAFLLSETGNESAYKRGTGTPELESALDQCVDTYDSWIERRIQFVTLLARQVDEESKWAARETFEGLSKDRLSRRLSEAKAWIDENKG